MNEIKKILVAVELDKESETVIEYGITLGLMLDAEVRCLHVTRPEINNIIKAQTTVAEGLHMTDHEISEILEEDIDGLISHDLTELRRMTHAILAKLECTSLSITETVRSDFAVAGIIDEATEQSSDLIIVGAHVDYKNREVGVTNLAKDLINRIKKQVIVVPSTYGHRNLDHMAMLIAFDFSEISMLQDLIESCHAMSIQLTCIHMLEDKTQRLEVEQNLKVYRRLFYKDNSSKNVKFICKEGEVSAIIDNIVDDLKVDLIALRFQKRHWNLLGFNKTLNKEVLAHLRVPIYVWK
jgi:nucleotide-binding universal stress UspA family protein